MMDYEMKEEDDLEQIITCQLCNYQFEDAIVLPCNRSICSRHLIIDDNNKYNCELCEKKHLIPSRGFSKNYELNQVVKIKHNYATKQSQLGKNNLKAKELCGILEHLLQKVEVISNNPLFYIHEYFADLKSIVDLEREKAIQMINENYFKILNEIDDKEKICINNEFKKNLDLNEKINSTRLDLSEWHKASSNPSLNDNKEWYYLQVNIEKKISMLNYTLKKYHNELLINQDFKFILKHTTDENNFGHLYQITNLIPNEERLVESIQFEINDFKNFINDRIDRFYKEWIVINKIPWKFIAEINHNSSYELMLFLYSIPDCPDEILEKSPFRALVNYKLLKFNGELFKEKSFEHTFIGEYFNGIKMCYLKEIMNEKNYIYDKENDLVKLQIDIKVIF